MRPSPAAKRGRIKPPGWRFDTLHGRALPWTFETAALEISPAAAVHCDERPPVGECAARAQIRRYHYLRGIDGKLPGDKDAEKRKKSSGDSPTAPPGPPSEATEGLDQSDYLRRLAEQLHERDVELRSNGSRGVVAGLLVVAGGWRAKPANSGNGELRW